LKGKSQVQDIQKDEKQRMNERVADKLEDQD
jgi:hypothetical protein